MKINTALIQKYIPNFFLPFMRRLYCYYQKYNTIYYSFRENNTKNKHSVGLKKNVLIYHKSLLSFGGTEKNLQIIAKYLNKEEYNVFVMYGDKDISFGNYNEVTRKVRKEYINQGGNVEWIPFTYNNGDDSHPYILHGMFPKIEDVISYHNIDLVITAGAGNAEFPLTNISTPIIFLNIFGIPNVLKNIVKHVCISYLVKDMIKDIVPFNKQAVLYIPSEGPLSSSQDKGLIRRQKLGVPQNHILFGRIGRADHTIYDPIAIGAFDSVVRKYPNIHYAIVSPSPQVIDFVKENKTPNVVFIDPISDEDSVRAFHSMIDVLAHYRLDGETCGLNIAESMLCGNPIISHKSHTRNAHLEYLDSENSFVADLDNTAEYAHYMQLFANDTDKKMIQKMGLAAKNKAYTLFHISSYMEKFNFLLFSCLDD